MDQAIDFHNVDDTSDGLFRELAPGVTTRMFSGERPMLSIVNFCPNAQWVVHHHPEEQWGVLLEGSAVRVQDGEEIPVNKGDFWLRPMFPRQCAPVLRVRACSIYSVLRDLSTELVASRHCLSG